MIFQAMMYLRGFVLFAIVFVLGTVVSVTAEPIDQSSQPDALGGSNTGLQCTMPRYSYFPHFASRTMISRPLPRSRSRSATDSACVAQSSYWR